MIKPNISFLTDEYMLLLDGLNDIVKKSGAPLEGNLFYYHHEPNISRESIFDYFSEKRCNYTAACRGAKRMLEVGLNGGHSALLALASGIEYHCVDICEHPYAEPVADFLKWAFAERFYFYKGDSLYVLPGLQRTQPDIRFDLIHIDGGHTREHCLSDVTHAMHIAEKDAWMIIDDTDLPHIQEVYDELVAQKKLVPIAPPGWVDNAHHKIGRIIFSEILPSFCHAE